MPTANYIAIGCLGAYAVYAAFFQKVQPTTGKTLFAPVPLASTPRTQLQPYQLAQGPSFAAAPPAMMWQANAAQPSVAYQQAPVYAPTVAQDEFSYDTWMLACFAFGTAAGYGAQSLLAVGGEEPTDKEKTIGAAGLGGIAGVVLFGSLPGALLLAAGAAYATTKSDAVKSAGGTAANVYNKALDIDQEYEVVTKLKSATDVVYGVADNLNKNYGVTDKIDEKLKISERAESLSEKISSLGGKVDELKANASK